jgi:hypothetical protein
MSVPACHSADMEFDISAPECELLNRLLSKYRDAMADLRQAEAAELADGLLRKLNHPMRGGVDQPDEALYSDIGASIPREIPVEDRLGTN